jgi:hypothetical protein
MRLLVLGCFCVAGPALAGPHYRFDEKVFQARTIVEVTYRAPFRESSDGARPAVELLVGQANKTVKVPHFKSLSGGRNCDSARAKLARLRALLFLDESGSPLLGVEHSNGAYSSLNPDYEALKAAIVTARSWPEERMQAVAAEMIFRGQKRLLNATGTTVYLRLLAYGFLRRRDSLPLGEKLPKLPTERVCG